MKCALVIPAWEPAEIFPAGTAASQINYWQPLGTLWVAAALRQAGHEVAFLNGAFLSHQELLSALQAQRPDFVGLYATTFGWQKAKRTAVQVRALLPEALLAAGGPFPTARPGRCLAECASLDAVLAGEAERTAVALLARWQEGQTLQGLAGVSYRQEGRIRVNTERPLICDLDSLPFPARDLLGSEEQYIPPPAAYQRQPVAVMMTSRGCNRRCIYCFQMDQSRASGIRYRSVENVVAEIEHCLARGYREIKFIDETLAADYDRALRLAREIRARRLDFTWFASACVNQVDLPLLQAFKKAGCWAILLGAESGVQKNLNTLRKGITLAQIQRAVAAAKQAGITVFTPFLFGIPGETYAEGLETIRFACELAPDFANFHALTPFPGTELHDNLARYGTASEDLSDYTYQGAAFVPFTMRREEITELRQLAFRTFYSRPAFLCRRLLRTRTRHDVQTAWTGLKSLVRLWTTKGLFARRSRAGF